MNIAINQTSNKNLSHKHQFSRQKYSEYRSSTLEVITST